MRISTACTHGSFCAVEGSRQPERVIQGWVSRLANVFRPALRHVCLNPVEAGSIAFFHHPDRAIRWLADTTPSYPCKPPNSENIGKWTNK